MNTVHNVLGLLIKFILNNPELLGCQKQRIYFYGEGGQLSDWQREQNKAAKIEKVSTGEEKEKIFIECFLVKRKREIAAAASESLA